MKVKRPIKRSMDFDFLERLAIGVAAAGGLVMAACISGLPSASCAALAETYARAISVFGVTAIIALLDLVPLIVAQQTLLRLRLYQIALPATHLRRCGRFVTPVQVFDLTHVYDATIPAQRRVS
jgi:hypothetical protein